MIDQNLDSLFKKLKELNRHYEKEGFRILGVFGSTARGEADTLSDLDLLYCLEPIFLEKHQGWNSFSRLEIIKQELSQYLQTPVDLADRDALDQIAKKYILPEVRYVA